MNLVFPAHGPDRKSMLNTRKLMNKVNLVLKSDCLCCEKLLLLDVDFPNVALRVKIMYKLEVILLFI